MGVGQWDWSARARGMHGRAPIARSTRLFVRNVEPHCIHAAALGGGGALLPSKHPLCHCRGVGRVHQRACAPTHHEAQRGGSGAWGARRVRRYLPSPSARAARLRLSLGARTPAGTLPRAIPATHAARHPACRGSSCGRRASSGQAGGAFCARTRTHTPRRRPRGGCAVALCAAPSHALWQPRVGYLDLRCQQRLGAALSLPHRAAASTDASRLRVSAAPASSERLCVLRAWVEAGAGSTRRTHLRRGAAAAAAASAACLRAR